MSTECDIVLLESTGSDHDLWCLGRTYQLWCKAHGKIADIPANVLYGYDQKAATEIRLKAEEHVQSVIDATKTEIQKAMFDCPLV